MMNEIPIRMINVRQLFNRIRFESNYTRKCSSRIKVNKDPTRNSALFLFLRIVVDWLFTNLFSFISWVNACRMVSLIIFWRRKKNVFFSFVVWRNKCLIWRSFSQGINTIILFLLLYIISLVLYFGHVMIITHVRTNFSLVCSFIEWF